MIQVMLAEQPRLLRGALVALLSPEEDIEIIAEMDSLCRDLPKMVSLRPDVTIIDIDHIGDEALRAAAQFRRQLSSCHVLALTGSRLSESIRRASPLRPHGLVNKHGAPRLLAEAIRNVATGQRFLDPVLALTALETSESPLTQRETGVLRLAAEGAPVTEIATRLFLSVGTVRNYLSAVISKTGARNRIDAIRIARESDWL